MFLNGLTSMSINSLQTLYFYAYKCVCVIIRHSVRLEKTLFACAHCCQSRHTNRSDNPSNTVEYLFALHIRISAKCKQKELKNAEPRRGCHCLCK